MYDGRRETPKMAFRLLGMLRSMVEPEFVIIVAVRRRAIAAVRGWHVRKRPRHLHREVERPIVANQHGAARGWEKAVRASHAWYVPDIEFIDQRIAQPTDNV